MSLYYNKFPEICSRCGSEHVVDTWKIESTRNVYDLSTVISALFGRMNYQKHKYTFNVPVCFSCKRSLQRMNQAINILTLMLIAGGFVYLSFELGIVLGLFGGLLGYFLSRILIPIIKFLTNTRIASYNGERFNFYNKKFMNAFVAKNSRYRY